VVPGFQEIVVIVLIAVLVVGPNRLPTVTRDVTKFLLRARGEVRTMLNDLKGDMDSTAMGDDLRELKRELDETRRMASQAMRGEPEPKPGPPRTTLTDTAGDSAAPDDVAIGGAAVDVPTPSPATAVDASTNGTPASDPNTSGVAPHGRPGAGSSIAGREGAVPPDTTATSPSEPR
jgi:sec-independent protein translocase protein TatB